MFLCPIPAFDIIIVKHKITPKSSIIMNNHIFWEDSALKEVNFTFS